MGWAQAIDNYWDGLGPPLSIAGGWAGPVDQKKIKGAYNDKRSPASINLSIATVYTKKKPKYFFGASAKVDFVVSIVQEDSVSYVWNG